MLSARLVNAANISSQQKVPILCAHGDTVLYPTAVVKLQTGPWKREDRVVVASNLPVNVLLGTTSMKPQCSGKAKLSRTLEC